MKNFCKKCQKTTPRYKNGACIPHHRASAIRLYKSRRDQLFSSHTLIYTYRLKIRVFDMYGNKCACCGETNLFFLELDHINNDGNIDRKNKKSNNEKAAYHVLKAALSNPKRFQILCTNCNAGKARNKGICPHKSNSVPTWFITDLMYGNKGQRCLREILNERNSIK